jgi:hypothetical protein
MRLGIVILSATLSSYGCGTGTDNTPPPTLTGNWVISTEVHGRNGDDITIDSPAYLTQSGNSISGVVLDEICEPELRTIYTIPVTGSLSSGQLSLMQAPGLGFTDHFLLNASAPGLLNMFSGQVFDICPFPTTLYVNPTTGRKIASFAGSWMGTLTSVSGPSATFSLSIAESVADGEFPALSGSAVISGSTCFTGGTLTGSQRGDALSAVIETPSGSLEILSGFLNSNGELGVSYTVQGGTCNGDNGGGTLARQ